MQFFFFEKRGTKKAYISPLTNRGTYILTTHCKINYNTNIQNYMIWPWYFFRRFCIGGPKYLNCYQIVIQYFQYFSMKFGSKDSFYYTEFIGFLSKLSNMDCTKFIWKASLFVMFSTIWGPFTPLGTNCFFLAWQFWKLETSRFQKM